MHLNSTFHLCFAFGMTCCFANLNGDRRFLGPISPSDRVGSSKGRRYDNVCFEQRRGRVTPSGKETFSGEPATMQVSPPAPQTMLTQTMDPSMAGIPLVDVVAPADLPGGYHFEAEIEGRSFLATAPAGGVKKGETFSCSMRDLAKVGADTRPLADGETGCSTVFVTASFIRLLSRHSSVQ